MTVVVLCESSNWPQIICYGALRGSATPTLVVHINLGSFYGVGLPLTIILDFVKEMGLLGLPNSRNPTIGIVIAVSHKIDLSFLKALPEVLLDVVINRISRKLVNIAHIIAT